MMGLFSRKNKPVEEDLEVPSPEEEMPEMPEDLPEFPELPKEEPISRGELLESIPELVSPEEATKPLFIEIKDFKGYLLLHVSRAGVSSSLSYVILSN